MDGSNPLESPFVSKVQTRPLRKALQLAVATAKRRPFLSYLTVVGLALGIYYFVVAAPVFVSSTQISIRGKDSGGQSTVLSAFIPSSGSGGISESVAVREYIHSPQMIEALDEQIQIREHFSKLRVDPFAQISSNAPIEEFQAFFKRRVKVTLDREAAILRIDVHAYSPKVSLEIAENIVALSESYVNALSTRIREETLRDAREELDVAADSVRDVRLTLADFRNSSGELDPASRGAASVSALIALEGDITRLRAELASQLAITRADAPQVQVIEAQIESLARQAEDQRRLLASENNDGTLAEVLQDYEGLVIEREYAETRLTSALAALDAARQLADQRERFVVTIVEPVLPGKAVEPRRLAEFCLRMVMAIIGFGIVGYAVAGIRDHEGGY